jgi:hypothetical protein
LHVEVSVKPMNPHPLEKIELSVKQVLLDFEEYRVGPLDIEESTIGRHQPSGVDKTIKQILFQWCDTITIEPFDVRRNAMVHDDDDDASSAKQSPTSVTTEAIIPCGKVSQIVVHAYILNEDDPEPVDMCLYGGDSNGGGGEEPTTACDMMLLPHTSLENVFWDTIILESATIQHNLLRYATTAMMFADKGVSTKLISWNRLLLLHGPPGTGKTTLCRALAHKLSIRLRHRYPHDCQLLEIHSHSLFSKWFSESGKLVSKLFEHISELCEDEQSLVCVLIDEVESLVAARTTSLSNGEPSDAVRTVNAMLTALDRLRQHPNVLLLTTTNMSVSSGPGEDGNGNGEGNSGGGSVLDDAFLDRADLKQYIGLPCLEARYEILRSCVLELIRVGIVLAPCCPSKEAGKEHNDASDEHEENDMDLAENDDDDNIDGGSTASTYLLRCADLQKRQLDATANKAPTTTHINNDTDTQHNHSTSSSSTLALVQVQFSLQLHQCAHDASGLSGRSLRKLPFQSFSQFAFDDTLTWSDFLVCLQKGIAREKVSRQDMQQKGGSGSKK